jgi:hypothetical protein
VSGIAELRGDLSVDARGELYISGGIFSRRRRQPSSPCMARASRSPERTPSSRAPRPALAELNFRFGVLEQVSDQVSTPR